MREQVGHGSKPVGRLGRLFWCLRRENQVGSIAQGPRGNAVPRFRAHDDRVVAAAGGSLGKMGHVGLAVRPRQPALVANAAIRAHGHDEFEPSYHGLHAFSCGKLFIYKYLKSSKLI